MPIRGSDCKFSTKLRSFANYEFVRFKSLVIVNDYIEVWLKVNPVTPTTDDKSVTLTVDNNSLEERQSIFPSTGLIGFTIDENIDSDTGEVIPEYIKKYNKEGADLVEQNINDPKLRKIKILDE